MRRWTQGPRPQGAGQHNLWEFRHAEVRRWHAYMTSETRESSQISLKRYLKAKWITRWSHVFLHGNHGTACLAPLATIHSRQQRQLGINSAILRFYNNHISSSSIWKASKSKNDPWRQRQIGHNMHNWHTLAGFNLVWAHICSRSSSPMDCIHYIEAIQTIIWHQAASQCPAEGGMSHKLSNSALKFSEPNRYSLVKMHLRGIK